MSREQEIREQITKLMGRSGLGVFNQSVYDKIEQLEFELQEVLGFKQDDSKHQYKNLYKFECSRFGEKIEEIKD